MAVKQETQVVDLSTMIEHYVKSFQLPEHVSIISVDTMLDPVKGKVILTLVIDEGPVPKDS